MSFLKAKVSFPSNVASIFSAIKQNFSILFLAQRSCTLTKKSPLKCKFLRFSSALVKIRKIPDVIFESTGQFSFKCCINIWCHQLKLCYTFFRSKLVYFNQKKPVKMQILRFSSAWVKIRQIPDVIFESTSQFSFKCCINI